VIYASQLHRSWPKLPIGSIDDIIGAGTCLILAPHPDDESLGCGGLIAACCASSRAPYVVILTDGSASHPDSRCYPPARLSALRETETQSAVANLGLLSNRVQFLREPDSLAPHTGPRFSTIVESLACHVQTSGCTAILAPWRYDPHCDHEAAALIASEVARRSGVKQINYPVWGWDLPCDALVAETATRGWRLNISAHLSAKRRAIASHASQHGGVITDSPNGFQLPTKLLRVFDAPWETFLHP
jgi:LmbE family N-acetylglucosaminyl deacetylase